MLWRTFLPVTTGDTHVDVCRIFLPDRNHWDVGMLFFRGCSFSNGVQGGCSLQLQKRDLFLPSLTNTWHFLPFSF